MRPSSPVQKFMPVVHFALALGLAAFILPTTLRPQAPPPPTTAQLSPDAPPDDQQVILSELGQGKSATAGRGVPIGVEGEGPAGPIPTIAPGAPSRSGCFGKPPRQIESVYSVPCVPSFSGNNGGATHRGVTATEIRIGTMISSVYGGEDSYDGPIPTTEQPGESEAVRTYRVLQAYFNKNMEFYGRQMRFYSIQSGQDQQNVAQSRNAAYRAAEEYKIFAAMQNTEPAEADELSRRGVVTFHRGQSSLQFYDKRRPYLWGATPSSTTMVTNGAEYVCKKLAHQPPMRTGDSSFDYSEPRKFGIFAYQEGEGYSANVPLFKKLVKRMCNIEIAESVEYTLLDYSQLSAGVARMRVAGVTTVIALTDWITPSTLTRAADEAQWFPEWFLPGFGGVDVIVELFQNYSPTQWRNAFGYSLYEVPTAYHDRECNRAYKSIDPDNEPSQLLCQGFIWTLFVQLQSALQLAGPNLTPQQMEKALIAYGRHPPDPVWRAAGGYGGYAGRPPMFSADEYPGDWTYPDYGVEIWYDPSAIHPENGRPGAYRYLLDGGRYTHGEWKPGLNPKLFKEGALSAPRV